MFNILVRALTAGLLVVLVYRTYGSEGTARPLDLKGFVTALRASGAKARVRGPVEQPFFSVPGRFVRINREDVQVFEYADEAGARAAAEQVSPDGGTVGGTAMMWAGPPHFHRKGRLVVLYIGEDATVLASLRAVLGPQFAGR